MISAKNVVTMKKNYFLLLGFALSLLLMVIFSCEREPTTAPRTIESILNQAEDIENYGELSKDTVGAPSESFEDRGNDERWECTTRTISVTGGSSDFPLFNTNSEVIFPGNMIQGKTIKNATPSPIVVKRAGGVISYNLNNGSKASEAVDEVKKSTIQDAMNRIVERAGVVPANFNLVIEEVQSEQQLAVSLGINVDVFNTQISANLGFSSDRSYNRFLVKLTQEYYTMSFDLPTGIDDLIHESVTAGQLATYIQPDNPATFISSVTYGRIFYLLVESTASSREMESQLNVTYKDFKNEIGGEVNTESFRSLENVRIKAIAYGGSAGGTFEILGNADIDDIAGALAESTDINAGLPLSYVLRSVKNPSLIVGTNLATEYDVKKCSFLGYTSVPPLYRPLVNLFDDGIGAMVNIAETNILVFNKAGTHYAWYNGTVPNISETYSIKDPDGLLGELGLAHVGAAIRFAPDELYLFDTTGFRFQKFAYESRQYKGNTPPNGNIGSLKEGEFFTNEVFEGPFKDEGIGAMCPTTGVDPQYFQVFSKSGKAYAEYVKSNGGRWLEECDLVNDTDGPCNLNSVNPDAPAPPQQLKRIGAGTTLYFRDGQKFLYVNTDGNLMVERSDRSGPWVIVD